MRCQKKKKKNCTHKIIGNQNSQKAKQLVRFSCDYNWIKYYDQSYHSYNNVYFVSWRKFLDAFLIFKEKRERITNKGKIQRTNYDGKSKEFLERLISRDHFTTAQYFDIIVYPLMRKGWNSPSNYTKYFNFTINYTLRSVIFLSSTNCVVFTLHFKSFMMG